LQVKESTTPAAKLPSVSMTPAANFAASFAIVVDTGSKFATGVNNTGGKSAAGVCHRRKWHQWQTMGKIIRQLTTKNVLEEKFLSICYLYYPKVSKRKNANFSDWSFFHFFISHW
jgi:hypothetical protein